MASVEIVVFALDERRYGLPLAVVQRVVRMAAFAPFPKAPDIVLGVLNLGGQLIPVLDVRRRFRLPARSPQPRDQLIVARAGMRTVALGVDEVVGLRSCPDDEIAGAAEIVPGLEYVRGVARPAGQDLIFIHDLETFLSLDEGRSLDAAAAELVAR